MLDVILWIVVIGILIYALFSYPSMIGIPYVPTAHSAAVEIGIGWMLTRLFVHRE